MMTNTRDGDLQPPLHKDWAERNDPILIFILLTVGCLMVFGLIIMFVGLETIPKEMQLFVIWGGIAQGVLALVSFGYASNIYMSRK